MKKIFLLSVTIVILFVFPIFCQLLVHAAPITTSDGQVFDAEYYAQNNLDVVTAFGTDFQSLYQHFILFGAKEGRIPYDMRFNYEQLLPNSYPDHKIIELPYTLKKLNDISYYEYIPANVDSNTPVIFAFHGYGASYGNEMYEGKGVFTLYTKIYHKMISPKAIIVYPTKDNGHWCTNLYSYSQFIKLYLADKKNKEIYYYGFSIGAYDSFKIIQSCPNVFKKAILVDGKAIEDNLDIDINSLNLSDIYFINGKYGDYPELIDNLVKNLKDTKVTEYNYDLEHLEVCSKADDILIKILSESNQ